MSGECGDRPRILCLHGYMQNANVFRKRTGALRKAFGKKVEFIFLDAPHLLPSKFGGDEAEGGEAEGGETRPREGRAWFLPREDGTRPSMSHEYCLPSWEASRDIIQGAIDENNGVDTILGFSQGATAASLFLVDPRARHRITAAVLFSGFFPRDESFAKRLREAGDAPIVPRSLHVMGSSDSFVSCERSMLLADCFQGRQVYEHGGGHGIPTDKFFRDTMKEFVTSAVAPEDRVTN